MHADEHAAWTRATSPAEARRRAAMMTTTRDWTTSKSTSTMTLVLFFFFSPPLDERSEARLIDDGDRGVAAVASGSATGSGGAAAGAAGEGEKSMISTFVFLFLLRVFFFAFYHGKRSPPSSPAKVTADALPRPAALALAGFLALFFFLLFFLSCSPSRLAPQQSNAPLPPPPAPPASALEAVHASLPVFLYPSAVV